jgi:2,3-bisphosphoglycerate-dependent phosphoglycerate mutase
MTHLVLVRHAAPEQVDPGPAVSPPPADPTLTARGRAQARMVASVLGREPVAAIFTSPARRARETAEPLCRRLGMDAVVEPALDEWDAMSTSYIPIERMRDSGDPRWDALERGETYEPGFDFEAYRSTVFAGIEALVAQSEAGTLALFTHAGVVNAYLGRLLGQPRPFWLLLPHSPYYASITRVDLSNLADPRVISINETSHLHPSVRD